MTLVTQIGPPPSAPWRPLDPDPAAGGFLSFFGIVAIIDPNEHAYPVDANRHYI